MSDTAWGFAIISGVVLIAVAVYTVIKLRKQVHKREREEQKKNDLNWVILKLPLKKGIFDT